MKPALSALGRWLVIGYGNPLRGDDALGPRIAEQVAAWDLPGVTALAVHQLTPELAAQIATVDSVLFVDASVAEPEVDLRDVSASRAEPEAAHVLKPGALLQLTHHLFGHAPRAWLLTVPAKELAVGEGLSESAAAAMTQALARARRLLASPID